MVYKFIKFISTIIFNLFWSVRVEGEDISKYQNSFVLVANHVSYLDPIVLGIVVKRRINFITKKEVYDNPFFNCILKRIGAIPVDKNSINSASIKKSLALLKDNHILGIFPEGTRSSDGKLLELNKGMIKIALQADVPIIPVGLSGTFEIYPPGAKFPSLFKNQVICINFGKPYFLDRNKSKDSEYIKESLLIIEDEIKRLAQLSKKEDVNENCCEVSSYDKYK
jgi:1-acyl-sn-glycerol-3-phosphate acyltransferase